MGGETSRFYRGGMTRSPNAPKIHKSAAPNARKTLTPRKALNTLTTRTARASDADRGVPLGRALVTGLCAGYFLVLLDVTVVNVALPSIGAELHAGHLGLAGIVDGYAIPLAALMLVAGAVGDRLGHRGIVIAGFARFAAASFVCAVAPTVPLLVIGRALQGIAAAMVLPGTLALLTELARDDAERTRLVGVWAALGGIALPAGPLVGGLFVGTAGWRSVFWLNVPIVALALVAILRSAVRSTSPGPNGTKNAARVREADGPNVVGRKPDPTTDSEGSSSDSTQAPTSSRSMGRLVLACAVAGLMNLTVLGTLLLFTQDLQDVRGLSPLPAGLATLPALLPLPLLGVAAGRLSGRLGEWTTSGIGLLIAAIGFGAIALSFVLEAALPWLLCPALAVWGCGIGILTPAIVSAAVHAVPGSPGIASGGSNTARQAGGAIGVAVFAAVAGSASAPAFAERSSAVILGGGTAFLVVMIVCFVVARRRG